MASQTCRCIAKASNSDSLFRRERELLQQFIMISCTQMEGLDSTAHWHYKMQVLLIKDLFCVLTVFK